jgi:lipopolysaccharide/colanic/teichoic acid biosynthesis glycosyltransferase
LYLLIKRVLDLAICLLSLPVVLPVLMLCAAAIRLDTPGPVFFKQERTGLHGVRFRMWKFRTMKRNADELKHQLQHLNVLLPPDFKIIDDPRITRVGKFLRRASLDELPQIVNVFRGEMTLVGPRPTSFPASTYALWHTKRLEVVPGVTGLWQTKGRNAMTFDERLRLDIRYVDTISLRLDLKILWWTIGTVLRGTGA